MINHEIQTDLELLFVERVLVEVLGPGSWKAATEPPLRNELVEADPCTPTVPEVDVSSSKPVYQKEKKFNFNDNEVEITGKLNA